MEEEKAKLWWRFLIILLGQHYMYPDGCFLIPYAFPFSRKYYEKGL